MKKILALMVVLALVCTSVTIAAAQETDPQYCTPNPPEDCGWRDNYSICNINTEVDIAGGGGSGTSGNTQPVVKCKWEYDLDVSIDVNDCLVCSGCIDGSCVDDGGFFWHDACPCIPGLQVLPRLGKTVRVGYYAVMTDAEGVSTIDHVYADVWHPDGEFKYQIELFPVTRLDALDDWDHVQSCHSDLVTFNQEWIDSQETGFDYIYDVEHELNQQLAYLYYGEAVLSYCQPGGYYTVGIRGHDNFNEWSDYLYNQFWYIPTTAIKVDFNTVDYKTAVISNEQWVGGDQDMGTPALPTVQNWGNTPARLYVWQDDMNFGQTQDQSGIMQWNVEYDVRLSADGAVKYYDPYENQDALHKGIFFGKLGLCTLEKVDFSIHVKKADPGYTYTGTMCLLAYREGNPVWQTPSQFVANAPGMVVQDLYIPDPPSEGPGPDLP